VKALQKSPPTELSVQTTPTPPESREPRFWSALLWLVGNKLISKAEKLEAKRDKNA